MRHLLVPNIEYFLDQEHPHYAYDKTFESAKTEPLVVVHTSGSTGVPKPLIWSHETAARHSNYCALEPPSGFRGVDKLHQGKRLLNTFPPFHVSKSREALLQFIRAHHLHRLQASPSTSSTAPHLAPSASPHYPAPSPRPRA
jgi:acyl-coenzyme A synthetase/AMP-(fatty) acid ligase